MPRTHAMQLRSKGPVISDPDCLDLERQLASLSLVKKVKKKVPHQKLDENEKENRETKDVSKNVEEQRLPVDVAQDHRYIKVKYVGAHHGKRITVYGWIESLSRRGSQITIILRDGTTYKGKEMPREPTILQCVLSNNNNPDDGKLLVVGALVRFVGVIAVGPAGNVEGLGGHKMKVDSWELVNENAPAGGAESFLDEESRGDVKLDAIKNFKFRTVVTHYFRDHYVSRGYEEFFFSPKTQEESGSTALKSDCLNGKEASLTPKTKFQLSKSDFFCIAPPSYQAEQSRTRKADSICIEARFRFITCNKLIDNIEDVICEVVDRVLNSSYRSYVLGLNPVFEAPKRPFQRVDYKDAIAYLKKNHITKEDGSFYEFGENIPVQKLADQMNATVLCRFPVEIKSFCTERCPEDGGLTESVEVFIPGVGEIARGYIRMYDDLEGPLATGVKRGRINPRRNLRRCLYKLELETFLTCLLNRLNVPLFPIFSDDSIISSIPSKIHFRVDP